MNITHAIIIAFTDWSKVKCGDNETGAKSTGESGDETALEKEGSFDLIVDDRFNEMEKKLLAESP